MTSVFLVCAIVGSTVLVFQFVMTIIGMGHGHDLDMPDAAALQGDVLHGGLDSQHGGLDGGDPHGSSSIFGVLSFKTIIAAITFFGVSGMAAQSSGLPLPLQLVIAIGCGIGAMYGVYYLMRSIYRLGESGNLRINSAIGKTATVYIPIPAESKGHGKVQVKVQERLEEFAAVTAHGEKLPTGTSVTVVGVLSGNTLEVEPLRQRVDQPV